MESLKFKNNFENDLSEDKFQISNKMIRDSSINQLEYSKSLIKYDPEVLSCKIISGSSINYDAHQNIDAIANPNYPLSCLELCDSDNWIKKYGLKTNKLTFENILSTIGFKQTQGIFLSTINYTEKNILFYTNNRLFQPIQKKYILNILTRNIFKNSIKKWNHLQCIMLIINLFKH
jgi:hypothetical protein